jgi:phosphoribosyl 1,2-cyclic phosphate phosphodiesterase
LKITFLGTGTSQGVPVIGCSCQVCQSNDPNDNRLRTSLLVTIAGINIVIDCGPDFRQQMLRTDVTHLHALLLTHEHNDHVIGMDDVRPFNFSSGLNMPIYATIGVQQSIKERFAYVFTPKPYPGSPRLELHTISKDETFWVNGVQIKPIEVLHGTLSVLGFRFHDFVYITDAKTISDIELEKLQGVHTLVLNALHHDVHYSHLNLKEALDWINKIAPVQAYLTHISHRMGKHEDINNQLPAHIKLAYDGLEFELPDNIKAD